MIHQRPLILLCVLALLGLAASAHAQALLNGWGPRIGLSSDPDQIFVGLHVDVGEIVPQLRAQPNVELGFGDNVTTLALNGAVHWLFPVSWDRWKPYAGGELAFTYLNFDVETPAGFVGSVDDDDTEVGLNAVGGMETVLTGGKRLLLEIKLGLVDAPDLKVLAGFSF